MLANWRRRNGPRVPCPLSWPRFLGQLEVAQRELAENERLLSRRRDELAVQRGRLSGIGERAALLDELERRHEGLTAGVQQVLARAGAIRTDRSSPWSGWWLTWWKSPCNGRRWSTPPWGRWPSTSCFATTACSMPSKRASVVWPAASDSSRSPTCRRQHAARTNLTAMPACSVVSISWCKRHPRWRCWYATCWDARGPSKCSSTRGRCGRLELPTCAW